MDTLPAAAFMKDQDGTLLYANRYLVEIMGEQDWKGKSTRDLFPPEVAEAMIADDRRSIEAGHVLSEEYVMGADGQLKTYQTHKFRIPRQDEPPLLGGIALDISERKRLEDQIRLLAFYDPLTNLPNHRLLRDRLGQTIAACRRTGSNAAVMMLDLDNFKRLNDGLGHTMGDQLLVETARRLTNCVREVDTVGRLGGDEFVVVLGELDSDHGIAARQAENVAEKIRHAVSAPYQLKNHQREGPGFFEHSCTASIGITMLIDSEARLDEAIDRADAAMYEAKASGRNAVHFYKLQA
jgi:diguanylate cyclase (GGDEF)-like protein/PAS domain S-box-containing protein